MIFVVIIIIINIQYIYIYIYSNNLIKSEEESTVLYCNVLG
jgi:hypothetical protein